MAQSQTRGKARRLNPINTFGMRDELMRAADGALASAQVRAEIGQSAEVFVGPALPSEMDKGAMVAIVITPGGKTQFYFERGSEPHRLLLAAGIGPIAERKAVWGSLTLEDATRLAEEAA